MYIWVHSIHSNKVTIKFRWNALPLLMTPVHSSFGPCRGLPPHACVSLILKGTEVGTFSEQFFLKVHDLYNYVRFWNSLYFKNCSRYCMFCFFPPQMKPVYPSYLGSGTVFENGILHLTSIISAYPKLWVLSPWAPFHVLWPPTIMPRGSHSSGGSCPKESSEAHDILERQNQQNHAINVRLQSTECEGPLTLWLMEAVKFRI